MQHIKYRITIEVIVSTDKLFGNQEEAMFEESAKGSTGDRAGDGEGEDGGGSCACPRA